MGASKFGDVAVNDAFDLDDEVRVEIGHEWDWLPRAQVARLRDHLNTLLGDAPAAKAETVVRGREYRLLPGSKYANGDDTVFDPDVTRVRVVRGVDPDGDVKALALGGGDRGDAFHVDAKYLAPLDVPTPAPDVAQAARKVAGKAEQAHHYMTARWFREFADLLEGKSL